MGRRVINYGNEVINFLEFVGIGREVLNFLEDVIYFYLCFSM